MTQKGAGASGTIDTTEHFYDADGVETKITYTAGGASYDTLKYYDGNGIMTKQTDWIDGTNGIQYGYDSDGRLTRITDYDGSHLDYGYDSVGRVTSMNDYHGNTVSYAYGSAGVVSTVTAPGSKVWTYGYDDVNVLTSLALPNGMTAAYSYDGDGRRTAIQYKDGSTVLRGTGPGGIAPGVLQEFGAGSENHHGQAREAFPRLTRTFIDGPERHGRSFHLGRLSRSVSDFKSTRHFHVERLRHRPERK